VLKANWSTDISCATAANGARRATFDGRMARRCGAGSGVGDWAGLAATVEVGDVAAPGVTVAAEVDNAVGWSGGLLIGDGKFVGVPVGARVPVGTGVWAEQPEASARTTMARTKGLLYTISLYTKAQP
jgi:hypothetical protein